MRLGVVLGAAPVALLMACSPAAAPAQTAPPAKPAEAKPTEAPKPAATAAQPAATKPAEAKPAAPAVSKGTVTIDWWVPNFHAAGAKPLKEKFEAANPNIKLNQIETVSQGLLEKVLTTLKGSTQPDLIDVANGWNPILSQAGLVADLSDRRLDTSDWLPGPLATAQYEGKLYGVPFRSEAVGLLWNKNLFQDAGLDPAKPPNSWDELTEMAIKANKPPDRYGFGLVAGEQNNTWFRATTFIWANEGDILSPDYKEAACNQPACVEAVQFYTDLATKHKVAPEIALTANTEQMDQLFTAGKVAMHITGQYIRPRIADTAPNLQWGARTTLPRKKIAGPLGGWNFVIPKGAKNPNETWTLIEFIIQPDNIAALNNANGVFPSRKSGLQNELFTKQPELAPFAEQLQYARAAPPIQQWGDVQKAFVTGLQSVIAGQASVQQAMDTAAADINKLLKKT
jgi:ABC-type glycerol-3-phosphate transport system substrate-binding protein